MSGEMNWRRNMQAILHCQLFREDLLSTSGLVLWEMFRKKIQVPRKWSARRLLVRFKDVITNQMDRGRMVCKEVWGKKWRLVGSLA